MAVFPCGNACKIAAFRSASRLDRVRLAYEMRLLLVCARMEKATGFLVVVVLVAAADVCTTVELVLETMVVPGGKCVRNDHLANILSDKIGSG